MTQDTITTDTQSNDASAGDEPAETDVRSLEALETKVEELEAENRRLREQYAATQRATYRRTALGLAGIGILTGVIGIIVTSAQTVLFSLAGIGVFAAVLTWFLTPEQFIPADVGSSVYQPLAANEDDITADLGLSSVRVYTDTDDGGRLFVPEHESYELPENKLDQAFVVGDSPQTSGVSFRPSARALLDEFEKAHTGPLPTSPDELSAHLTEGVTQGFELADSVERDVATAEGRVTFEIRGPRFGQFAQFDHPVQSFLALGMARRLETPVTVEWASTGDSDVSLTVRWDSE